MRLIDADALKESMIGACNIFEKHGIDTMIARAVISIIDGIAGADAEPTVDAEPVRRGRWATEWISVKDRLPMIDEDVLVFARGKGDGFIGKTKIATAYITDCTYFGGSPIKTDWSCHSGGLSSDSSYPTMRSLTGCRCRVRRD